MTLPALARVASTAKRAAAQDPSRTLVLILLIAGSLGASAVAIVRVAMHVPIFAIWSGPQYLLSYDHGFVRRALPGELLHLIAAEPSSTVVAVAAFALTTCAVVGVFVLAVLLGRAIKDPLASATAFVLVIGSPFTIALFARDPGRFDALGVICLCLTLILTRGIPVRWLPVTLSVSLASAVMVASQEFLVVMTPLLIFIVWRWISEGDSARQAHRRWLSALIIAIPSAAAALASMLTHPEAVWLTELQRTHSLDPGSLNSVSAIAQSFEQANAFATENIPNVVFTTFVFGGLFILSALTLKVVARFEDRAYYFFVALGGVSAFALTAVGIDLRRWWSLAFLMAIGAAISALRLPQSRNSQQDIPSVASGVARSFVIMLTLICCLFGQNIPGIIDLGFLYHAYQALIFNV